MLADRLRQVREILRLVASWTSTTIDDKALELLDAILASDELIDWFEVLISRPDDTQAMIALPVAAQGLNISLLFQLIPFIRSLLELFGDD